MKFYLLKDNKTGVHTVTKKKPRPSDDMSIVMEHVDKGSLINIANTLNTTADHDIMKTKPAFSDYVLMVEESKDRYFRRFYVTHPSFNPHQKKSTTSVREVSRHPDYGAAKEARDKSQALHYEKIGYTPKVREKK